MAIFIISIVVLGLGVVLMKEYGWADLTGNKRNDLVFEKRNKKYGAYEIRQTYSNRLLISFVAMLGFISIAAVSPKMFMGSKTTIDKPSPNGPTVFTNPTKPEKPIKEKEKIKDNIAKPEKSNPSNNVATKTNIAPVATNTIIKIDSTKNEKAIVSKTDNKGDSTTVALIPGKIPGKGNDGDCLNCPPKDSINDPGVVDEQASFNYKKFFRDNLHIPTDLGERGVKGGKIHVSFIVDESGNVSLAKIRRGVYPELDNEVRRVASIMPQWKPAKIKGVAVKVRMVIPVNIVLE